MKTPLEIEIAASRRAEEILRHTVERESFRLALSDTLRPLSNAVEIQAEAVRMLGEYLGASRVLYAEIINDGERAVVHQDYCNDLPSLAGTYLLSAYGPWFLHEYRARRTTVTPDVANAPYLSIREKEAVAALGVAALVVVPIVKEGQWTGLLAVFQDHPREWTAEEVALMEETAERTWDAVVRAYAEAALRASEERLRIAIEVGNIFTWETDVATGRVIYSETVDAVLGFALTGNLAEDMALLHPDDHSFVTEQYQRVLQGESAMSIECRILSPVTGEIVWVRMQGTLVDDLHGGRARLVGVTRNITQRKQAEEALRQINRTLETLVEERTGQVRKLVTQLTLSEQEERRRISGMLHDDLQQRLFSLGFQLVALRSTLAAERPADAQLLMDEIEQALHDAVQVTRNLSVDLSPPVLNNEGLFEVVRWLASQMAQQQGLEVTVDAESALPPLHEDLRELLFQIVRELLFNIVKHAGVDSAGVTLACKDEHLSIEVSDKGRGFDADAQKAQGSQGLTRIGQRLQLIGGHMQIDSRPGAGTRIALDIPLRGTNKS
ncbi:MAG: PAS domain S-box protein [Caldilineaceae bacterium]|nr:PAS domain S-box protein [Caldilineaceae bacterium]